MVKACSDPTWCVCRSQAEMVRCSLSYEEMESGPAARTLILRSALVKDVVEHLQAMGLPFSLETKGEHEQLHYSCEVNGRVLEVYAGGSDGRIRFSEIAE